MELSKFLAYRPLRDEAIRRMDAYLKRPQEIKEAVESWAMSHPEAFSETPKGGDVEAWETDGGALDPWELPWPLLPTGYLCCGKLDPWGCACNFWPAAARKAANLLREAGETVEANGICEELDLLPTYVDWDWERSKNQHDVTRKAARQVKMVLKAIRPDVRGGHRAQGTQNAVPKRNRVLKQARDAVPGSAATGDVDDLLSDPPEMFGFIPRVPADPEVVRPVLKALRDEAAGTAGPQLAGNITPPETDNGRGQRDNAGDKKKMSPRGLSSEARACAKLYKTKRKADTKITMRAVILEYIEEHGGSFSSIKKSLSAHPDEWKTHNKRDN